jgi:hypothetical protein
MYKLEFTLKQHTPLIHFQHDLAGATLRASEVKPKLDFFIMKKLLNDPKIPDYKIRNEFYKIATTKMTDRADHLWKNWLVGKGSNEHVALDYKIRILSRSNSEMYVVCSYLSKEKTPELKREYAVIDKTPYFAQEKEIKDYLEHKSNDFSKLGIISKADIQVQILSIKSELLEEIKKYFNILLSLENFGTRQNKGFGSFFISGMDKNEYEKSLSLSHKPCYVFIKRQSGFEDIFRTINSEYKILKSDAANKISNIKEYFNENDIEWEKSAIYAHLNGQAVSDTKYKYIRSFLGLAELYEFTKHLPKFKVKIKHLPDESEESISRFKSPLTFKVFDGFIYLLYDEIPKKLMGKQFEFSFDIIGKKPLVLSTPIVHENFISDFLKNKLNQNWKKLS